MQDNPNSEQTFDPEEGDEILIYREEESGEAEPWTLIAPGIVKSVDAREPRFRVSYRFNEEAREDNFYTDEIQPPLADRHLYPGF